MTFLFDLKINKYELCVVEGSRVDAVRRGAGELGVNLRNLPAILWCEENYPEARFLLRNIRPPAALQSDLVISGIHPLIDGMTWSGILVKTDEPVEPLFAVALLNNLPAIIKFVTPNEGSEPGWVLNILSESKAMEFRIMFWDQYPLVEK